MNTKLTEGCFAIIFDDNNRILLFKRKDYPFWDLPGGILDSNEELETCVIRETLEETGYHIIIRKKIGEYLQWEINDLQHLYSGAVIGGQKLLIGTETVEVKWFELKRLPYLMIPHRKKQIQNYIKHNGKYIKELIRIPTHIKLLKYISNLLR